MILAKDQSGVLTYLIASRPAPPTSISAQLYSRSGVAYGSSVSIAAPGSKTLSSVAFGLSQNEGYAALTRAAGHTAPGAPGDVLRVLDGLGLHSDCICIGNAGQVTQVADYVGSMTSVASCWNPEIQIPIPAALTSELGDGYRVALTLTYSGTAYTDTLWFGVAPYPSLLEISPREYVDFFPEASQQLMQVQQRADWKRLIAKACEKVEAKLRGMDRWANCIVSSQGQRRAVAAAVGRALAPSYIPNSYSSDPSAWVRVCDAEFTEAVRDLISGARYDAVGNVASAPVEPPARTSYKVL